MSFRDKEYWDPSLTRDAVMGAANRASNVIGLMMTENKRLKSELANANANIKLLDDASKGRMRMLVDALIRCEGLLSELDRDLPGDAVCGHAMETTLDIARDALARVGRCVHSGCVNEYVEENPLGAPGSEGNDPGCLEKGGEA